MCLYFPVFSGTHSWIHCTSKTFVSLFDELLCSRLIGSAAATELQLKAAVLGKFLSECCVAKFYVLHAVLLAAVAVTVLIVLMLLYCGAD